MPDRYRKDSTDVRKHLGTGISTLDCQAPYEPGTTGPIRSAEASGTLS